MKNATLWPTSSEVIGVIICWCKTYLCFGEKTRETREVTVIYFAQQSNNLVQVGSLL
jgi:hypothetical protein